MNSRCRATQIEADSYDLAAVLIQLKGKKLLLVACYEARAADTEAEREEDLAATLTTLRVVIQKAQQETGKEQLEIMICADLNRYHVLLGGYHPVRARERRGEADTIVDFMQEAGLHSLLPAGTVTWEHQSMDITSTVDLILGSKAIQEELVYCRVHSPDHGSDHKPIKIEVNASSSMEASAQGKRLYKEADWECIRKKILDEIGDGRILFRTTNRHLLDFAASLFTSQVNSVLEEEVPRARPSPYAKRWWTRDLSALRDDFTTKRNRVTVLRRRGDDTTGARLAAHMARRLYHDAIDRQKKKHWKEFLEDPENIWKAARYTKASNIAVAVPDLVVGNRIYYTDEEKADLLMGTFFPQPPDPHGTEESQRQNRSRRDKSSWPLLTKHEVERAIFRSSPDKSPGTDGITFRVWRELWPVVGDNILWLYSLSLDLGHVPKEWKIAKIVAIRKPGKADYTVPKAFRPISLLQTLGKGLEAVIAARMSYLTEKLHLLPDNHFGGRPRRSAEHALNVLVERIYQAWRKYKILTLISFDVKGAFNGVHSDVLIRRLKDRRAPEQAVRWIADFCKDRKAKVVVGKFESEEKTIDFPGIPQGSPLSPLLYIWYNADLVDRKIDTKGGALGFIDDFNAWVTGVDEDETTKRIQEEIIPHAEQWAKESGAIFEEDKTCLIHFTRKQQQDDSRPVSFNGVRILPQKSVKVLGLTLDKKLGMDEHIARAVRKGTQACLSLQAIKGIRPTQLRQLYRACVVPITDYAASSWYGPGKPGVIRLTNALDKVQRLGARMILRAWKTVAMPVLEAEASLEPTVARLLRKSCKHAAKVLSLPTDNPVRQAVPRTLNVARQRSPLDATIAAFKRYLKPEGSVTPLGNPAWLHPPWSVHGWRVVIQRREEATDEAGLAAAAHVMCLYTDASVGKRLAAVAVVQRMGTQTRVVRQEVIGWAKTCSVLAAELAAIAMALE